MVELSVVIGFKDWGSARLELAVKSAIEAMGLIDGEVIVSDYGSTAGPVLRNVIEALGARYIYTATDGVWSRSRALNAGFQVSRGNILVSTDADMLFLPGSFEKICEAIGVNEHVAQVLQCRDLPEGYSERELTGQEIHWSELHSVSRLRPRWGMGGMIATSRRAFMEVRGLDERMEIYGGEDIDFAQRLSRVGVRIEWIDVPEVRMYHMWHPPTRAIAAKTKEGADTVSRNRDIMLNDKTVMRNIDRWAHKPKSSDPIVSVVIATRNRQELIAESIYSVLAQSFTDFEVVVVDDGSEDQTGEIVTAIEDDRVKYFKRPHSGLAASRNFGASMSRGKYTVVHDDDDIMLPWRIQSQLSALEAGDHGTYGGWVDFDDVSGVLSANYGRTASLSGMLFSSRIYLHGTLMIRTDLFRAFKYDETLRSGSDYNLAVRMLRSGVSLRHTSRFHIARRLHAQQVTVADSTVQGLSARATMSMMREAFETDTESVMRRAALQNRNVHVDGYDKLDAVIRPYLPSHLSSTNTRSEERRVGKECPV